MANQEELVEDLFEAALPLSAEERSRLLDRTCKDVPDVRRAVEMLLTAHAEAGSFLSRPIVENLLIDESSMLESTPAAGGLEDKNASLQIGTVIAGRFMLNRFVARGGMGEVYEAWDSQLQERIAIKTIRADFAKHPEVIERFRREVKQSRAISHPNVCRVHELFCEEMVSGEKLFFLSMEFLEGPTLNEYIRQHGPFSAEHASPLIQQISQGLIRAHSMGVVHRDLKTKNIMLVSAGEHGLRAVITDFGLALSVFIPNGGLQERGRQGTPAFMAPEQLISGKVTFLADQYALGMVICEMLTGSLPKRHEDVSAGSGQSIRLEKPLPAPWLHIVRRCLEEAPEDRYPRLENLLQELNVQKPRSYAWSAYAVAGCVVLGVAAWFWSSGHTQGPSLAVFPLLNKGADPNLEYLGAGISEALTNDLAQMPGLQVTAESIASRYRGTGIDLNDVSRNLHVGSLVEGSFTSSNGVLRVPIELVDVKTGAQIWGKTYEGSLSDLPVLQHDISTDVAYRLKVKLDPDAKARLKRQYATNADTYNAYLKGRFLLAQHTPEALKTAIAEFQKALTSDTHYAPAYAGLADCYSLLAYYGTEQPVPLLTNAMNAADTALKLDSTLGEAYASRAFARTLLRYEWKQAEEDYKRAIELNPNDTIAHIRYALALLTPLGRDDEAAGQMAYAQAADPNSIMTNISVATMDQFSGHIDDSIHRLQACLQTSPDPDQVIEQLAFNYVATGRPREAVKLLETSHPPPNAAHEREIILAIAYASAGETAKATTHLQSAEKDLPNQYPFPYETAIYYTVAKDHPKALDMLEIAFSRRNTDMVFLNVDPLLTSLRAEPRFRKLLTQMNLDGGY